MESLLYKVREARISLDWSIRYEQRNKNTVSNNDNTISDYSPHIKNVSDISKISSNKPVQIPMDILLKDTDTLLDKKEGLKLLQNIEFFLTLERVSPYRDTLAKCLLHAYKQSRKIYDDLKNFVINNLSNEQILTLFHEMTSIVTREIESLHKNITRNEINREIEYAAESSLHNNKERWISYQRDILKDSDIYQQIQILNDLRNKLNSATPGSTILVINKIINNGLYNCIRDITNRRTSL